MDKSPKLKRRNKASNYSARADFAEANKSRSDTSPPDQAINDDSESISCAQETKENGDSNDGTADKIDSEGSKDFELNIQGHSKIKMPSIGSSNKNSDESSCDEEHGTEISDIQGEESKSVIFKKSVNKTLDYVMADSGTGLNVSSLEIEKKADSRPLEAEQHDSEKACETEQDGSDRNEGYNRTQANKDFISKDVLISETTDTSKKDADSEKTNTETYQERDTGLHHDSPKGHEMSRLNDMRQEPGRNEGSSEPADIDNDHLDSRKLPLGWCLKKLLVELPLSAEETISCVSSYGSSIYIGTSIGQLLHSYLFEDADQYIVILQLKVGENQEPIKKILVVPDSEMCLVLKGKTVHSFTLPELSPCRAGKVKDVEDISLLSEGKSRTEKNKNNKVIMFTSSKLRVLHVIKTGFKLLRDINYTGALLGISSASGASAHYSNICILANDTRYDVVDMQKARKIPLFDYNPSSVADIQPYIIPYITDDLETPQEEYLLSICTEEATSMAMLINSAGDVTRGTLTWVNSGYPQNGMVIDWPYVIGIFGKGSKEDLTLVASSLHSLKTVTSVSCDTLFSGLSDHSSRMKVVNSGNEIKIPDEELSYLLSKISCIKKEPVTLQKQFTYAKSVFCDKQSLIFIQKRSSVAFEILSILEIVKESQNGNFKERLKQKVRYFETLSASDLFGFQMFLVLLLLSGEFERIKQIISKTDQIIDPRLLLFFCVDSSSIEGDLWETFSSERVFFDIQELSSKQEGSKDFYKWLIKHIYTNKDTYDPSISSCMRIFLYRETCRNSSETIQMIDFEKDLWQEQNIEIDQLLNYFETKNMYIELLYIYIIKQNAGDTVRQWCVKIIDLCLKLLSKSNSSDDQQDTIVINAHRFDLLDIAFRQLRENIENEAIYTKNLLNLLQLRPDRGLALLKSDKGVKFASTHKFILEELSKSIKFDTKFILLKIEYTEESFLETSDANNKVSFKILEELLKDYIEYLSQEDLDIDHENLNILYNTYQVENDLRDPSWPKVTWIEYLHLHFRKSDYQEYLAVYLKVYEVLVLHAMFKQKANFNFMKSNAIDYLSWIVDEGPDRVEQLREIHDYSTAEWFAIYSIPPVPRNSFFLEILSNKNLIELPERTRDEVANNVVSLLQYYLSLSDKTARNLAMMHALSTYADEYLSLTQVFQLLQDNFPLMYAEKYLLIEIHNLENRQTDIRMMKALHKSQSKLHAAVLRDFVKTLKNAQMLSHNSGSE